LKKIVLGTAQFSGNYGVTRKNSFLTKNEAHKILKTLLTKKLRHLDTSIDYENSLNKINSFNFNNWQITTKMDPKKLDFSSEQNLYLSVENQIKLIKQNSSIKTIKNLLIRNSDMILTTKGKILYKVLKKIKKNKLIINFGYSIYSFKNLEKIIINFKPDLIQCPYNVFDRRIENIKIKNILKKKKIKVQARSIFLQGVLLKKIDQLPKFFHKWKKLFLNFENSIKINRLTALSLCFNFVNNNKDIDEIVIGVQNNKELKEILNIELKRKILMSKELFNPSLKLIDPTKW
jgi:aryl-alcohol dehydrogenase-like predicted oxidoreductase